MLPLRSRCSVLKVCVSQPSGRLKSAWSPYGVSVSSYHHGMRVPNWLRGVLRPGDHWVLLWLLAWVPLAKWGEPVAFGLAMTAPLVLGMVAMAVVSFGIPPARPLRETSALINRLAMFSRGVWAATLFACAGVFGAWVAIDLDTVRKSTPEVLRLSRESVSMVVTAAAVFVGLLSMMGVAWDLNRAKGKRREAIWRLTAPLLRRSETRRFHKLLDEWLDWLTSSWRPWVFAYPGSGIVVAIWNTVLPCGDKSLVFW